MDIRWWLVKTFMFIVVIIFIHFINKNYMYLENDYVSTIIESVLSTVVIDYIYFGSW